METKNLLNELTSITKKEIKNYGITGVFIYEDEAYVSSCYELPEYILSKIEKELGL